MLLKFVLLPLLLTVPSDGTHMTLEVETSRGNLPKQSRSAASGGKTLQFKQGDASSLSFCLMRPTMVRVFSVAYTNDGNSDVVQVKIGNQIIGSFDSVSHSGGGALWNVVESSAPIGTSVLYGSGIHRLKLKVLSADAYGIELDRVVLDVNDPFLGKDSKTFSCELPCLQDTPPLVSQAIGSVVDGHIKQNSYPTPCAEEDNVDIAVFHSTVHDYCISATPPLYHSLENHRAEDTSNCVFLPPEYWKFQNVPVNQLLQSTPVTSNDATFGLSDANVGGISTPLQFGVVFRLKGRSVGHIDSEIGSKVDLTLSGLTGNADVSLLYKGRAGSFLKEPVVKFTPPSHSHTWNMSDFTWIENGDNELVVKISTSQSGGIVFDTLRMERRYMGPDKPFSIFSNDEVMIEGIDVDFWWRAPETMRVTLTTTGQTWDNVDYMRISVPVPWNTTWSEVFVMYQDGNVRLLPIALKGTDWIPYGTSVIVGQTNADDHRPVAPISHVFINPDDFTMKLDYMDSGHAKFELLPLVEKTKLLVNDLHFAKDTNAHPFATFRSMFVDAGNDDSDSVMTDKSGPDHVMGNWGTMAGTSFLVHRRCQSDHLTQSPDLRVDILN